ncbi:hypothetical protein BGW36DRAFT_376139 [Talaromyces proteolyticus]|uniref:Uncharacterized protein n=1 Tax=Talaromyces proteolyticus TaxID=1131652 RepID=A0AAD4KSL2_9EURO|nr:uncharacterized protein BGW36DRAFT_376139 [Talaromyces proteolyticus]KAH8698461.1 hypothetical protein BGW36DRAFT_376139 [Talaromyces proteolyticus]
MSTIPADTVFFDSVSRGTGNSSMVSLTYSYGITGTDFGLQRTPDLQFNVTGSCFTDYSWYTGPQDSGNIQTDGYKAYNDSSQIETITSEAQGPPYVKQVIAPISDDSASNTSFGLIVTSFGRYSFTPSNDPWYLTEHSGSNPVDYAYTISRGRPGLSCWENATWTYQGSTSATESLNSLTHGDLSSPLTQTFQQYLFQPMVLTLSGLLGRSALASSTLTVSQALNAELCSIENDISRLVNIAYLMTRNILSDSTLISPLGRDNITNLVRSADQRTVLPGADEFVVSGPDIMTLSVRDLILIPTLLGGVVCLVIIFANLPGRWRLTNDLNAVKLQKLKRKAKHQNAASESKSHEKELEVPRDEESLTTKDAIDVQ